MKLATGWLCLMVMALISAQPSAKTLDRAPGRLAQAIIEAMPSEEGGAIGGCPRGTISVRGTKQCARVPDAKSAKGPPVTGRSLGGIVRSRPDQASRRLASLKLDQRIRIARDTGVEDHGYNWFEIRFNDRTGYQWGGIICADVPIPGVFQVCKT